MVKPPTTMQPEAVDLEKAGRASGKAFQDDSFQNYMARKIHLQRQQFGLVLPPEPMEPRGVHFALDVADHPKKKKRKKSGLARVLKKLKRRHGRSRKRRRDLHESLADAEELEPDISAPLHESLDPDQTAPATPSVAAIRGHSDYSQEQQKQPPKTQSSLSPPPSALKAPLKCQSQRPDLFFFGVVVLVNGYTNPDTETLQRLLHKHGGDLERYETHRVTHIIAEHLSTAKAKIYKQRRKPIPVCYPSWITDSVTAMKLLPHGAYLIDEVRENGVKTPSVLDFFQKATTTGEEPLDFETTTSVLSHSTLLARHGDQENPPIKQPLTKLIDHTETPDLEDSSLLLDADFSTEETPVATGMSQSALGSCVAPFQEGACLEDDTDSAKGGDIGDNGGKLNLSKRADEVTKPHEMQSPSILYSSSHENTGAARTLSTEALSETAEKKESSTVVTEPVGNDRRKLLNGRVRTVGTDPDFLDSFFAASRLSFIGSYKQRAKQSPSKKASRIGRQKRFILHVDMDCFFASVVLRNYPEHRDKPVAISHCGKTTSHEQQMPTSKVSTSECSTCNYHARKYGIKKGMFLGRAKELCPDLVVLQYDFEGYKEVSEQVEEILARKVEELNGTVEHVSCDEAFIELFLSKEGAENPRSKVASIAECIRTEIYEATQCTATVGVASNKFLAKLATDRAKPNKSFVVDDYRDMLQGLNLSDLHGIGYRSKEKLRAEGLVTVQDYVELGESGEGELCRILGPSFGKKIADFCRGIDNRPVKAAERKTIGAECNYGVRFNGQYGPSYMILGLAKEVEKRMTHIGVTGQRVTLKVKRRKAGARPPPKFLGHGSCHNMSKGCDVPNGCSTRDHLVISTTCGMLLSEMNVKDDEIRGMGIVMSKLSDNGVGNGSELENRGNLSILDWLGKRRQETKIDNTPPLPEGETSLSPRNDHENQSPSSPAESIVEIEEIDAVNTMSGAQSQYCDIDLPSLSQIHMSQVEALPSGMKSKILSRIDAAKGPSLKGFCDRVPKPDGKLFQVDMRRLMKLAAVKSGDQSISNTDGNAVSMSELESLPLGLQLQIANSDNRPLGSMTKAQKSLETTTKSTHGRSHRALTQKTSDTVDLVSQSSTRFEVKQVHAQTDEDTDTYGEAISPSFFMENIKPLSVFFDENDGDSPEALEHVAQFFLALVNEQRFQHLAILLRSMKRRRDSWSGEAFERIFESIDAQVQQVLGESLDIDWV